MLLSMKIERDGEALLALRPMAMRLGIHPRELRTEAEGGGVPCVRVGSRGLLFDPELVLASLARRARSVVQGVSDGRSAQDRSTEVAP